MTGPYTSPADRGLPFFVLPTEDGHVRHGAYDPQAPARLQAVSGEGA